MKRAKMQEQTSDPATRRSDMGIILCWLLLALVTYLVCVATLFADFFTSWFFIFAILQFGIQVFCGVRLVPHALRVETWMRALLIFLLLVIPIAAVLIPAALDIYIVDPHSGSLGFFLINILFFWGLAIVLCVRWFVRV